MRVIKFRGKSIYSGDWLLGSLVTEAENGPTILHQGLGETVGVETVGEFIGVEDRNNIGIYEDDIIFNDWENVDGEQLGENHIVKFGHHMTSTDYYASEAYGWYAVAISNPDNEKSLTTSSAWEIVGNIHDDPELLETKKDPTALTVES